MAKVQRVGNTIVALICDKMYQKEIKDDTERLELYEKLLTYDENSLNDVKEMISIFIPEPTSREIELKEEFEVKKEEAKKVQDILDFMKDVKNFGHDIFEVVENSIYVKGINISVPELLVREIIKAEDDIDDDRLNALINFWSLCALNLDPRARHDAFRFIKEHKLTITPAGHFLTYRRAHTKKAENTELEKFVTQEWSKKKRHKKSPKNYNVYENDDTYKVDSVGKLGIDSHDFIGNLNDLYENIAVEGNGSVYTDNKTKTFDIKIGEVMREDRGRVDPDPEVECSRGIHTGSPSYVNGNSWLGDTVLACLVNPRHITAVPKYDSTKMRSCEILPIAIAELDENGYIVEPDYEVFDYEYAEQTQEELDMMSTLSSTELEEYKKNEFISPEIDFNMLDTIRDNVVLSVEEANKKIQNRVVKV